MEIIVLILKVLPLLSFRFRILRNIVRFVSTNIESATTISYAEIEPAIYLQATREHDVLMRCSDYLEFIRRKLKPLAVW